MRSCTVFCGLLSLLLLSLVSASPVPRAVAQLARRDNSTTPAQQVMNLMNAQELLIEQYLAIATQSFSSSDPNLEIVQGFLDAHQELFGDMTDPALDSCSFDFSQVQTNDSESTLNSIIYLEDMMAMSSLSFLNNATALGLSSNNKSVLMTLMSVSYAIATVAASLKENFINDVAAALNFGLVNMEAVQLMASFRPDCPVDLGLDTLTPTGIEFFPMTTPFLPGDGGFLNEISQSLTSQCPDTDSCSCQLISSNNSVTQFPLTNCEIAGTGEGLYMTIITRGNDSLSSDPFTRASQTNSYIAMIPIMFGMP